MRQIKEKTAKRGKAAENRQTGRHRGCGKGRIAGAILLAMSLFVSACVTDDSGQNAGGSGANSGSGNTSGAAAGSSAPGADSGSSAAGTTGVSSAAAEDTEASQQFFAMDTVMDVTVYGTGAGSALAEAVEEIGRLDGTLAAEREGSEVYQINEAGEGRCSNALLDLIALSQDFYEATDGAFNICLYPIKKLWGFTDGNYRVPDESGISMRLPLADPMQVEIVERPGIDWGLTDDSGEGNETGGSATALFYGLQLNKAGMEIDLGGIAKGYAADCVREDLQRAGMTGAKINLGGNVLVAGTKPDGTPWRVGLQDPDGTHDYLGVLELTPGTGDADPLDWRCAVVTSGGYERYFEQDGVRYHHILDPTTGYPAQSGLVSATIVAEESVTADALSTAAFVMGLDRATQFWRTSPYDFQMILLDEEGTVHVTEGLAPYFTSDYAAETIRM